MPNKLVYKNNNKTTGEIIWIKAVKTKNHKRESNNNNKKTETKENEDDFDYEYDEDYNNISEEDTGLHQFIESGVLFLMEVYGTFYGLSYGLYAQINYFFHVNILKDREPEHLSSLNNNNITVANQLY